MDKKTRDIDAAFYRVCANGTLADLKELVLQGANPDAPYYNANGEDFYPIHQAALNPDLAVLKYVVSLGVDPCRVDYWAREPLSFAVRQNSVEFARYLVELGNRAWHMDDDGMTVLAEAALNPHDDVLDFLISHEADLDDGAIGMTPIEIALYKGTPTRVAYFIAKGASIRDAVSVRGSEAPVENLRILLQNGYDPDTVNDDGTCPERVFDRLNQRQQALFTEFGASPKGTPLAEVLMRSVIRLSGPGSKLGGDALWDEQNRLNRLLSRLAESGAGLAKLTDRPLLDAYLEGGNVSVSFYVWQNIRRRDEWSSCGFLTAKSPFDATGVRWTLDEMCEMPKSLYRCRRFRLAFFPISVAIGHSHVCRNVGYIATERTDDAIRITSFFLREEFMDLRIEHRCLNILRAECKKHGVRLVGMDFVDNGQNSAVRELLNEAEGLGFFSDLDAPYLETPIVDGTSFYVYCHGY